MAAIEYERYTYYNYSKKSIIKCDSEIEIFFISIDKLFTNSPIAIQCKEIENGAKFHFVCV